MPLDSAAFTARERHPIATPDPTIARRIEILREFDEWRQDHATTKVFDVAVEQYEGFLRAEELDELRVELATFLNSLGLTQPQVAEASALLERLA